MSRVAIIQSRQWDPVELVKRSPVAGVYDAELLLKRWLKTSEEIWVAMYDGEIAAVWGLAPPSVVSDRAYLWLFTTNLIEEHKFLLVRHSQLAVRDALTRYSVLTGHVSTTNRLAKRWLEWLGAEFGPPDEGHFPFVIRRRGS
jgi:hypothetical protein